MPKEIDPIARTREVAAERGTFRPEAYLFVMEALETAMEAQDVRKHISGEDLLDWIRKLAASRYGVMAGDVFNSWGVHGTLDFGRIVFHLIEGQVLRKRQSDSLSDFIDKYDFEDAFSLKARSARG